jgi:glycosyltransferase involved in cell wall biosynthesis
MNIKKKLTIVIPSYNEQDYIENTIASLVKQIGIKGTKVIISDNHSTDKTRELVSILSESYKDILKIEIIDGGNVSQGRNNGAKMVNTDYILFIDSDVMFFNNNVINDTLNEMIEKKLDLITCRTKSYGKDFRTKLIFKIFNPINKITSKKNPFAIGTYFMTKTDKFYEYGMFDESLNHSEDYLLSNKYNPKKFKISKHYVGQDDRRFKKMGYIGMVKLVLKGFLNRKNNNFFKEDHGYWK